MIVKIVRLTGVREEGESTVLEHLFCVSGHSKHEAFAAVRRNGWRLARRVLSKQRDAHYARLAPVPGPAGELRGWSLQRAHLLPFLRISDESRVRRTCFQREYNLAALKGRLRMMRSILDRESMES